MSVILPAGIGVILIILFFYLFKWKFPSAGRPIAAILGVLALAAYAPYAITHWPGADVVAMVASLMIITAFMLGLISPPNAKKSTFHWGPAAIIAFFAVIILLDSIFLTFATRGLSEHAAEELLPKPDQGTKITSFFPGTVAHDYQLKQKEFNKYNQTINAQISRGWKIQKGWVGDPVVEKPSQFRVEVKDKQGDAVSGAKVTIEFMRPADKREDFQVGLLEVAPGVYQDAVRVPEPGLWEVIIDIHKGEEKHEIRARTEVNPASK